MQERFSFLRRREPPRCSGRVLLREGRGEDGEEIPALCRVSVRPPYRDAHGQQKAGAPIRTPAPEPEPEPAPEPEPIELPGAGVAATQPFQLESGLTIVRMTHQGSANFIVDLLDENGARVAPMGIANVIGPIEGSQAVQVPRAGQHLLNVQADGPWSFRIEQPRPTDADVLPTTSFSGNAKTATELFWLSGGLHTVQLTHQGDANFIVDLLDENGVSVVPMGVVNEIGPFQGSQAVTIPDGGIYLFQVEANGPWTIEIE